MRKNLILILAAVLIAAGLTGCNSRDADVTETTIEVKKNKTVVQTIIEDFSEPYYDLDSLTSEISGSIEAYNEKSGKQAVTLTAAEAKDGIVKVVLTYQDSQAYSGFNKLAFFAGSIKDAYNAGYNLDVQLQDADASGEQIGKAELLSMGDKNVVILREALNVKVWGKILYYTEDVTKTDAKQTVRVSDDNRLTFIVFD